MSNVGYDLDTSGGLMPLIRALIKPPDEEGNGQKAKKPQHPYYKRPGKGHNHDSCDACGEGGDLICCDRCPASFHLGCYDPPLEETDIPTGLWLCRECKASDAEKPASSRGSRAVSPADSKSDSEKKTRTLRNRSNSKKRSKDESDDEEEARKKKKDKEKEKEKEKDKEEEEAELTPMEVLVKAARIMNPTQFELPKEMQVPCIFPGTDKEGTKNSTASVVTTDSSGCVPLPAKCCYVCLGTCKQAPLLQCDYCPLLFHLDCLDPPLTALPTGRWMCPNHVEKYIDWKLVNSISMTERVALWDRFQAPVDQHAIKIDFIRRARKHRPMFRMKIPVACRGRVSVPEMVRAHYANPPPLLPSRREHVRCRNVLNRLKAAGTYCESEEDDGTKHTICMNLSCPEYRGEGDCEHSYTKKYQDEKIDKNKSAKEEEKAIEDYSKAYRKDSEEKEKEVKEDDKQRDGDRRESQTDDEHTKMELTSDCSSDLSDSDFEYLTMSIKRRRMRTLSPPRATAGEGADELLAEVDHQLRKIDEKLLRILAWQRLQQVLVGEQCYGAYRHTPLSEAASQLILRSLPAPRRKLHPLPSELLSGADRARIAAAVWGAPVQRPYKPPPRGFGDAPVKACLVPAKLNGSEPVLGEIIPMRVAHLTIGTDSGCDLRLDPSCRNVSRNHAVIFMDEVSRHFELINYSEFGSLVNGVLYTCDVTHMEAQGGDVTRADDESEARAAALKDIVKHRMPKPYRVVGALTASSGSGCRCRAGAAGAAWEGSALLSHAASLQFGCHQYVFSITHGPTERAPAL